MDPSARGHSSGRGFGVAGLRMTSSGFVRWKRHRGDPGPVAQRSL